MQNLHKSSSVGLEPTTSCLLAQKNILIGWDESCAVLGISYNIYNDINADNNVDVNENDSDSDNENNNDNNNNKENQTTKTSNTQRENPTEPPLDQEKCKIARKFAHSKICSREEKKYQEMLLSFVFFNRVTCAFYYLPRFCNSQIYCRCWFNRSDPHSQVEALDTYHFLTLNLAAIGNPLSLESLQCDCQPFSQI